MVKIWYFSRKIDFLVNSKSNGCDPYVKLIAHGGPNLGIIIIPKQIVFNGHCISLEKNKPWDSNWELLHYLK